MNLVTKMVVVPKRTVSPWLSSRPKGVSDSSALLGDQSVESQAKEDSSVKYKQVSLHLGKISVILAVIGGAVLSVSVWRSSAFKNKSNKLVLQSGRLAPGTEDAAERAESRRRYLASIHEGLSEVAFASADSSDDQIRSSVESVARFISRRSGIELSSATQMRLAAMEARSLRETSGRSSTDDLYKTLTRWLVERVSTLTDQELEQGIDTLRGFNSPDLPGPNRLAERNYVHLRASVLVYWTQARDSAKSFRDRAAAGDKTLTAEAGDFVKREIETKTGELAEASPERFMIDARQPGRAGLEFTPLQSFLVAYSLVSDDKLAHSEVNLAKKMNSAQEFKTKMARSYPSPDGHRAYGVNGYLHSSPVDLFFGKDEVDRLLTLLDEGRQL